ncbi:MAG: hypothetical protein MK132_18360 [Lentisphaerales bacterium]|nr:hypothetical protein [Lentisphaerales bacterium]
MKLISTLLLFFYAVALFAETTPLPKPKHRVFKATIINGKENIQELKKSLNTQSALRNSALKIKFSENKNAEQLKQFEEQFAKLEAFHAKKYGMLPGMTYQLVNEKATVSLLLSDEQLNKLSDSKSIAKNSTDSTGKLKKYPQFEINSSKAIQQFLVVAKHGTALTKKIEELKKSRQTKEIADQKKIIEELKKLEAEKTKFDEAMNKKYGIRPKLDYIVDITSVALYLVLEEKDLNEIAAKQRTRYEAAYKKQLNESK